MPRKLAEAHPDDKAELVSVLSQSVERNTGAKVGTGSGPNDLPGVLAEAVAKDDVVEQHVVQEDEVEWASARSSESEKEDQEEKEEPKGGQTPGSQILGLETGGLRPRQIGASRICRRRSRRTS